MRQETAQQISEADARAEGMAIRGPGGARDLFRDQWCEMHGATAWADDLAVIVLAFTVVNMNVDALPD